MRRRPNRLVPVACLLSGIVAAGCARSTSQTDAPRTPVIVPTPVSIQAGTGEFIVTPATAIVVPPDNEQVAKIGRYLSAYIGVAAGPEPPAVLTDAASSPASAIRLTIGHLDGAGDEGYELTVASDRVVITANAPAGLFYGVQTFRQL